MAAGTGARGAPLLGRSGDGDAMETRREVEGAAPSWRGTRRGRGSQGEASRTGWPSWWSPTAAGGDGAPAWWLLGDPAGGARAAAAADRRGGGRSGASAVGRCGMKRERGEGRRRA